MRSTTDTIVLHIPEIAELVAYLRGKDDQQTKIDALAAKVAELSAALSQSGTALEGAVADAKEN